VRVLRQLDELINHSLLKNVAVSCCSSAPKSMVKRVLVIVSSKSTASPPNWYSIFSGIALDSGEPIEVDQAE
jgi:hypothetical protein